MKILELRIQNIRGIRDLHLKPEGKTLVIYGPNGSGKSAVADALDFLLTGQISRLLGEGTRGITLQQHGSHIDCESDEAVVWARVQLQGIDHPVEIKRCIATPNNLETESKAAALMEQITKCAKQGQHILTRRELLRFVKAKAGVRAQEFHELLQITDVEKTRLVLVSVRNELDKIHQQKEHHMEKTKGPINALTQASKYEESELLKVINQNREVLGGKPISILFSEKLKEELEPPTIAISEKTVNIELFNGNIENLLRVMTKEHQSQVTNLDIQLRNLMEEIRSDPSLLNNIKRASLFELGITLIDETGNCPLCDRSCPPGRLQEHLGEKLEIAQSAAGQKERIKELSSAIVEIVNNTVASIENVIQSTEIVELEKDITLLGIWKKDLEDFLKILEEAVTKYPNPDYDPNRVQQLLAPEGISHLIKEINQAVTSKSPKLTPEQTAWDTLTQLEVTLKVYEEAKQEFILANTSYNYAKTLYDYFESARDNILKSLYAEISERFATLYCILHGDDEAEFSAEIAPDGPGLKLEVGFHGRGTHPPHALHSEGHQDSMGVCLHLVLAERLTEGLLNMIILDDIVMSIDSGHRRAFCQLIQQEFTNRQFLITTHDRAWVRQLQSVGLVSSRGLVEFYNWSVETGPRVSYEPDMWTRIKTDLDNSDVPSAAARLRRGSEQYFAMVCNLLEAPVRYKLDGQWELGELLPSAIHQYRKLLNDAKEAANSWNKRELLKSLKTLGKTAGMIFARTQAEQWALNANVHYNNWVNFTVKDFQPVVDAFGALYSLFGCVKCNGMLYLAKKGNTPIVVRCTCGKISWNLEKKEN